MNENLVRTKFVEVPRFMNIQDKFAMLRIWTNDMQRNGITILSTSQLQTIEEADGTVVDGFTVEYRLSDLAADEVM